MNDKMREEFEAWAGQIDLDLNRAADGYSDCNTDYAWGAWQAAKATQSEPLTDRQLLDCFQPGMSAFEIGRAIEAAHNIKEQP